MCVLLRVALQRTFVYVHTAAHLVCSHTSIGNDNRVRFRVLTAMRLSTAVLGVVTPCGLVGGLFRRNIQTPSSSVEPAMDCDNL
jgi:hypothetical protein